MLARFDYTTLIPRMGNVSSDASNAICLDAMWFDYSAATGDCRDMAVCAKEDMSKAADSL